MISITNKENCTGCTACVSICPRQCIRMQCDEEGFLYPSVQVEDCINCNMCVKTCPVLSPKNKEFRPLRTLAVISSDEETRLQSSSGGAFSLLSSCILNSNGIVYGAAYNDDWKIEHQRAESIDDIRAFRGAKYFQSELQQSFKQIKSDLNRGKNVLFTGTPCQVAGLKAYLRVDYNNLYTIDVICHGVPSYKVFHAFLQEYFPNQPIVGINFRNKETGWKTYNLCISYREGEVTKSRKFLRKDNVYMDGFIANLYLRPSCYQCPAKKGKSGSDITLGDCWGIEQILSQMDDQKGTSLVLVNTQKGAQLFTAIQDAVRLEEIPYESAVKYNKSLEVSSPVNPWRPLFFQKMMDKPFTSLVRSFEHPSLLLRIERKLSLLKDGK